MNHKILLSALLCSLCMSPFVHANDKVDRVYNAQTYQKVCKGKMSGAEVNFVYRGILWNGNCETQFFPNKSATIMGNESGIFSTCTADPNAMAANIDGVEMRGKCMLGFAHPRPR